MKRLALFYLSLCFLGTLQAQTLSDYQSTVTSQVPIAYFKLDGTLDDAVTPDQGLAIDGTTGAFFHDVYRNPTNAYCFFTVGDDLVVTNQVIYSGGPGPNADATGKGSVSLVFRTPNSLRSSQLWICSGGDTNDVSNALGLFLQDTNSVSGDAGDLKLRVGDIETTILPASSIPTNATWYYVALTWDETRDAGEVVWYLGKAGGSLTSGTVDIANDAVIGDDDTNRFALGHRQGAGGSFCGSGNDNGRIDEVAFWDRELSGTEVTNQFTKLPSYKYPAGATYEQVLLAQKPTHYFSFTNSLTDVVNPTLTLSRTNNSGYGSGFGTNQLNQPDSAMSITNRKGAVYSEVNLVSTGGSGPHNDTSGLGGNHAATISLLFKTMSSTDFNQKRYLFWAGNKSSTTLNGLGARLEINNDATYPNDLIVEFGGSTFLVADWTYFTPSTWYYFALDLDESRNNGEARWYIGPLGGTLTNGVYNVSNDSAVAGANGWFYIGNRNLADNGFIGPGNGYIDEFATWDGELSEQEIQAQFAAATNAPVAGPAPSLGITLGGSDIVLSWPDPAPAVYQLERTASLEAPDWQAAGSPTVIASSCFVTNTATDSGFYRLHKQ